MGLAVQDHPTTRAAPFDALGDRSHQGISFEAAGFFHRFSPNHRSGVSTDRDTIDVRVIRASRCRDPFEECLVLRRIDLFEIIVGNNNSIRLLRSQDRVLVAARKHDGDDWSLVQHTGRRPLPVK